MLRHAGFNRPKAISGLATTELYQGCLLYTSDAADERSSVDLGGRRIIKKKKRKRQQQKHTITNTLKDVRITPEDHTNSHDKRQK
mgnify:CR=1 FL=1